MAPKWYEYARQKLMKEEEIEKNFEGRLDGNFGYLFATNKRLLFVKQKGFLRKSHDLILDLPHENMGDLRRVDAYKMEIAESGGKKHVFESEVGVSVIENSVKQITSN